tara:strand:- start:2562 stop:3011 length:450 start_codon:yes stop_codon:yes gene_type:complete
LFGALIDPEVKKIAQEVRDICYKFAMSGSSIDYNFHGKKDMKGMYLCASQVLREVLRRKGIRAYVCTRINWYCFSHTWVQVGATVVDVTHSQFGSPDILIAPCKSRANRVSSFKSYHKGIRARKKQVKVWNEKEKFNKKMVDRLASKVV